MLLKSQESCIVIAGITMSYVDLEKGARLVDPVSAYLFILCLEVLFLLVKANHKIRILKSVKVAVFNMKCVDLWKDTITISCVHFPYNKTKQDEKNLWETVTKIKNILKIWRMRSLTFEDKIIIFKILAISKIVYLSMMIKVPTEIIIELGKNTKTIYLLFTGICYSIAKIRREMTIPTKNMVDLYKKNKKTCVHR